MIFRLHGAGDGAEEIFHGGGHTHHAVCFELADVDDGVRLLQICRTGELPRLYGGREGSLRDADIGVEHGAERLRGAQARHVIDMVKRGRRVEAAGAVADDDLRAVLLQQANKRADDGWMDGRGSLRLHGGDKIQLERDTHARLYPVQPAGLRADALQRVQNLRFVIASTGGQRNGLVHRQAPPYD